MTSKCVKVTINLKKGTNTQKKYSYLPEVCYYINEDFFDEQILDTYSHVIIEQIPCTRDCKRKKKQDDNAKKNDDKKKT